MNYGLGDHWVRILRFRWLIQRDYWLVGRCLVEVDHVGLMMLRWFRRRTGCSCQEHQGSEDLVDDEYTHRKVVGVLLDFVFDGNAQWSRDLVKHW